MLLGAENGKCTIEDESSVSAIKDIIGNHTLHDWLKTHHKVCNSIPQLQMPFPKLHACIPCESHKASIL
jgi:hypothetical protein